MFSMLGLVEQLKAAKESGVYFITVTYKQGKKLKHYQIHSNSFDTAELLPSLEALQELVCEDSSDVVDSLVVD